MAWIRAQGSIWGLIWHNLTANDVRVTRLPDDLQAEQVRVFILRSEPPAYDSLVSLGGWQNVAMGSVFTFTHNLNWPPEMLIVRG